MYDVKIQNLKISWSFGLINFVRIIITMFGSVLVSLVYFMMLRFRKLTLQGLSISRELKNV